MNETIHERIKSLILQYGAGKNTVFASLIGVSEGNVRGYAKNVLPKADVLEKIVRTCDINAMWLLTGLGDMQHSEIARSSTLGNDDARTEVYLSMYKEKEAEVRELYEQIGALKERITQLERGKGRDASDAHTSNIANVG